MDAGYRGRAAPCQRERSDRALDQVTAVATRPLRHFLRQPSMPALRSPGRSRTVTATCRRSPGERSEAGAVDLQPRTSGHVVETDCGRPPPTGTTVFQVKPSTVPWVFTSGLHGLPALSGVLAPPCVTVRPGMSAFSRDFYFWTGRTNPPSAQIRGRGPELPLNRHGHVLSSVCLALTPSRRHRGVDRQEVADIAAWGRTAGPCLGAD